MDDRTMQEACAQQAYIGSGSGTLGGRIERNGLYVGSDPTREGGIIDRMRSTESLLSQLHDEINMLESALHAVVSPYPEGGNKVKADKTGPSKPGSNVASGLAEQNASLGHACERIRTLRQALDL